MGFNRDICKIKQTPRKTLEIIDSALIAKYSLFVNKLALRRLARHRFLFVILLGQFNGGAGFRAARRALRNGAIGWSSAIS